jgi:hypothetical protein
MRCFLKARQLVRKGDRRLFLLFVVDITVNIRVSRIWISLKFSLKFSRYAAHAGLAAFFAFQQRPVSGEMRDMGATWGRKSGSEYWCNSRELWDNETKKKKIKDKEKTKKKRKKKYPSRNCRECTRNGQRRETRYICAECKVPLHKGQCFSKYHSQANFLM